VAADAAAGLGGRRVRLRGYLCGLPRYALCRGAVIHGQKIMRGARADLYALERSFAGDGLAETVLSAVGVFGALVIPARMSPLVPGLGLGAAATVHRGGLRVRRNDRRARAKRRAIRSGGERRAQQRRTREHRHALASFSQFTSPPGLRAV